MFLTCSFSPPPDYKESFRIFDKNKDGTISLDEIMTTFHEMNLPLTRQEASDLINEFDSNGVYLLF